MFPRTTTPAGLGRSAVGHAVALGGLPAVLSVRLRPRDQPRLTDAGPRPAKITARSTERLGASGALLVATGRQSFEGTLPVRCAVHEGTGLQVNLRTGDPDLPAVAVRIDEVREVGGPYRGRLFVTGRSRTGALAISTGQVSLELEDGGSADGPVVLKGSFDGTYDGMAGKGSVEGRFRGCSLTALSR